MSIQDIVTRGQEMLSIKLRVVINLVETDKDELLNELSHVAKEIRQLRKILSQINANDNYLAHDRAVIRLDAAERDYFLLFNRYRVVAGYEPIKNDSGKFGGEHSYESFLF